MMMRTSDLILGAVTMLVMGCGPAGLPPVAPEEDASQAEVGIVEVAAPLPPLTRSAFEGEALEAGGGHEHRHHGHGKAPAKPEPAEPEPEEPEPEGPEGHEGHAGHGGRS